MKHIWLLADDRAGNVNQLLGVAEALGWPAARREIRYTRWVRLPNMLRGASLLGLTADSRAALKPPFPDVVLSAGRRSFPAARWIKKASGGKTKIVQLMHPGAAGFGEADLVVLPVHDGYRGRSRAVMSVVGTPHRITEKRLAQEREKWEKVFRKYPRPRLSLIVGGATKDKPFTAAQAHELAAGVKLKAPRSILVTTSRRTPEAVIDVLKRELPEPLFFYQFGGSGENPYFGLLACADEIVVTGDSMSMCSECCAAGVPVSLFAPETMVGAKHRRFLAALAEKGYAALLGAPARAPKGRLNPAAEIAARIKKLPKG